MSSPQNIGDAAKGGAKYHWWYDSKASGVRNVPGINMSGSPPSSPSGTDAVPRRFSLTSGWSYASSDVTRQRRDSLKNMHHLSDFGTPDT